MKSKFVKKLGQLIHQYTSYDNKPTLVMYGEAVDIAKKIVSSKKYKGIERFDERFDPLNNNEYEVVFSNEETIEKFFTELKEKLN